MGTLLARPSRCAVNHRSETGDGHSCCQLISGIVETPLSTAAIGGRYFAIVVVESGQECRLDAYLFHDCR